MVTIADIETAKSQLHEVQRLAYRVLQQSMNDPAVARMLVPSHIEHVSDCMRRCGEASLDLYYLEQLVNPEKGVRYCTGPFAGLATVPPAEVAAATVAP